MVPLPIILAYVVAGFIIITPIVIVIKYNKNKIKKLCEKKIITVIPEEIIPAEVVIIENNESNNNDEKWSIIH
mgnify:CR=1 FL=1